MEKEGLGLEITELRLGLPGSGGSLNEKKRVYSDIAGDGYEVGAGDRKMETKNQLIGWPPVCSHRRKNKLNEKLDGFEIRSKRYVKISMDGEPFLRKLDIGMQNGYSDLTLAMERLFDRFAAGNSINAAEASNYVPIYEDKDGDWMLVGDVPWEIFLESCKRVRIMKQSEFSQKNNEEGNECNGSFSV